MTERNIFKQLRNFLFGNPLNPNTPGIKQRSYLVAFLAWVGLGADGLSSACYGPEAAFIALNQNNYLVIFLAIAITFTVFVIATSYNQVIELFPSGGGGYKVATKLLGPLPGLVSGGALVIDYVLTIAISIASGMDALFSLLPIAMQGYKLTAEIFLLVCLVILNLRGHKESIKILMPIFLSFVITHVALIIYGISAHINILPQTIQHSINETFHLSQQMGWIFVLSLLLRAYSLGGGTYTGIEAVSNNVNNLAPPRITTGKWTMFYMACSLAFTASGITLLYLLWHASPVPGQTLNAVTFSAIFEKLVGSNSDLTALLLFIVMLSEACLLFVAAQTGFLAGPVVLANMAADSWVPSQFKYLSSRLVTQNGIVLMGLAALLILLWTRGAVRIIIIMYSINVFLTFSMTLLGLSCYWIKNTSKEKIQKQIYHVVLSLLGLSITSSILIVTTFEKFTEGGWVTLFLTSLLIVACYFIKQHYLAVNAALEEVDKQYMEAHFPLHNPKLMPLDHNAPTAVLFVGGHSGVGMHTLLKVRSLFPNQYKNFVFLSVGSVDTASFTEEGDIKEISKKTNKTLMYFVDYCRSRNIPVDHFLENNIDVIAGVMHLAEKIRRKYPQCVFFGGTLIFERYGWLTHWLHNHTATIIQQRLLSQGMYAMLIPLRLPYHAIKSLLIFK